MKKVLFCVLLNIISVFSIFASETINSQWIKKDETIIRATLDLIKKEDFTDKTLKNLINKNKVIDIESHNQGFGLQKFSGSLPGGYLSIYITYISYNDEPCKLIFNMDKDDLEEIKKYINKKLLNNFLKTFSLTKNIYDRDIYRKVFDFSDINKKFLEHKKNKIGDIKDISLSEEFQKYYDFLYYCENETEYGYFGGIEAVKPMGREAMEELLKLNNKQVFINLLKGDNPCGRIYAAEGLLSYSQFLSGFVGINQLDFGEKQSPSVKKEETYGFAPLTGHADWRNEYDLIQTRQDDFEEDLMAMAKLCAERDVRFVVIVCPFTDEALAKVTEAGLQNMQGVVDRTQMNYPVEYHNYLADEQFRHDTTLFYDWSHLNSEGAKVFTQRVKEDLGL